MVSAVPVAPRGWQARIGTDADEMVCISTPRGFSAIGQFYARFGQVSDEEVLACWSAPRHCSPPRRPARCPLLVPLTRQAAVRTWSPMPVSSGWPAT